MTLYQYQIGGSLTTDAPSYVERKADLELYNALKKGEFCYILNSRQMGKSSLIVKTRQRLQEQGFKCATIDMSSIGSKNITPLQWYKGVVAELCSGFKLYKKINLKGWWSEHEGISLLQKLSRFISEVLLVEFPNERLFIFIDEIDSILNLDFSVDDFFALIRYCYNQRAIDPKYNRVAFAIFGVATPSDLIQNRICTPFNIGKAIEIHGFQLEEAQPLVNGLAVISVNSPQAILKEILGWTNGQPFLTQKLCQLVITFIQESKTTGISIFPGTEAFWVERVVRERLIAQWTSQDEPEHLRTICNRILANSHCAGRMLGLYQQILQGVKVPTDDSHEQIELLLSGLVVRQQGYLQVKNRIYQEVFNLEWVEKQLGFLRPYSQMFDAWLASKQTDSSRLLRGQALIDAQIWSQGKSLNDLDYQFLAASNELDRREMQQVLETQRLEEVEARLAEERRRLAQEKKTAKAQRLLIIILSITFLKTLILGGVIVYQYQQKVVTNQKIVTSD
ncbi:AAA-like domain-containing protein [Scytonema sp. NUACC26]|uniref:AAA-like domain-containing protein n=1 Tax=Scytonema sp. NUACC26 TaxID=3140176 RepID=UPI0034DB8EE1